MDELIGRLVSDVGIDRTAAETAVGIILDFLVKEGPADKMQLLLAKLPGAEALMQKAAGAEGGGMGGVMGAGMAMMSARAEHGPGPGCYPAVYRVCARESRRGRGRRDRRRHSRSLAVCLSRRMFAASACRDRGGGSDGVSYHRYSRHRLGYRADPRIGRDSHYRRSVAAAKTPKQRLKIAEKVGADDKRVLDWVTAADRMRVKGVGWEYSELLRAAGVKTVNELKFRNPQKLVDQMTEANGSANWCACCRR